MSTQNKLREGLRDGTDDTACRRCGGPMLRGHALQNTLSGTPDFAGDPHPVTISRTGPAKVVPCLKCVNCGYSIAA